MSNPSIKKDANGLPVMVGINERITTQTAADMSDVRKALQTQTGLAGENAREMLRLHPEASAGLIVGLAKAGAGADNTIISTLSAIDAQTRAQRAADAKKASDLISTQNFNNTLWGKLWTGVKAGTRIAGILGNAILENISADIRGWGYVPTPEEQAKDPLGIKNFYAQQTIPQIAKQLMDEGKVDLGAGFFASEQTGAGFAARKAQIATRKVAFKVDGETYYRPYSIIDPVSYVLTGGHPESSAARVINALGEIGLAVATDPYLAYSKVATGIKEAQIIAESATGIKAAKAAERLSILKSQEATLKLSLNDSFEAMLKSPIEKDVPNFLVDRYNAAYNQAVKVKDEYGNITVDYAALEKFISGAESSHIIDAIANTDNWMQVQKLAKGKLTTEEAVALAGANSREQVLEVLAPFIANGTVAQRALETGTVVSRGLTKAAEKTGLSRLGDAIGSKLPSVLQKGDVINNTSSVRGSLARSLTRSGVTGKIAEIGRKYHAYLPEQGGSLVHITNKDKLIEVVNNVGTYVGLDKTVLDNILTDIAYSTDRSTTGMTSTGKLFDAIFDQYASRFSGEQLAEFKKLTRVFETERKSVSAFWAQQHAVSSDINFALANGGKINLHSSHLDSELLNSFVYIPDASEIMNFLKTAQKFGNLRVATADIASLSNNIWKKSVMVRPAYIARNIIEEQIRVFGKGHISFFSSPLAAMAMWLGRDTGPQWKVFLNRLDDTRNDVHGDSFKMASSADELNAEQLAGELVNPYVSFMSDAMSGASGDGDINKILRSMGYSKEVYGHELWWQGFASQARILHNSEFVRKVIATKAGKELDTVNYFLKGEGRKTLDEFARLKKTEFKDWITTEDGLMNYLFTGLNEAGQSVSVLARIEEMAGKGEMAGLLKTLLLKGTVKVGDKVVTIPNAKTIADHAIKTSQNITRKGKAVKTDLHKDFARTLEGTFKDGGTWDNVLMVVPSETSKVLGSAKSIEAAVNNVAAKFFDKAVQFEKTTTMGPEWRQSYWDAIHSLTGALDETAIASLRKNAAESLNPLRNAVTGKNIGTNHKVWRALDNADGMGPLTLDEAHRFATNIANRKVADLFYNATKRNLLYHQLRLIFPFGQAWEDTLKSWGKLALDNPNQVYKVAKISDWSTKSSSSALYEFTDAKDYYDPNQGIFYSDPQTGERKFFVPLANTALNVLQTLVPGSSPVRKTGPYAFSATPQSFNFALGGGSFFPGFGWGVTWGVSALSAMNKNPLKILPPQLEEEFYKIAFPYGTPDVKNAGLLEGPLFTNNWVRILGSIGGVESSYAAAFAPSMGYLASSGDYNLNDPEDQARLARDGDNMARYFTMWRGILGALTPIPFAMKPEALAKNKNADTVLATSLFSDFKNMEVAAGGNKDRAYADFLDTYGPEQVFAITRTTTGYEPTNLPTYLLIRKSPEVLDLYPDTYGYFYPNGQLSKVLYEYQQSKGSFTKLSARDIMDKATNIRFAAAKDRLSTRSVAEGWSSDQYDSALKDLTSTYDVRGRIIPQIDIQWRERALVQLQRAADDPRFGDSDAVTAAGAYLTQRQKAIDASGMTTLNNAASAPQRAWLAEEGLKLMQKYPDFQKLFYGIFKKELEG